MNAAGSLVALFVAFLIFLILREVWCWYWKINAALEELVAIRTALQQLAGANQAKTGNQGEFAPPR